MPTDIPDQQLRNEFGVRNTHPTGEGEQTGDRYYNDGTGILPEGRYVYDSTLTWVLLGGGGGGGDDPLYNGDQILLVDPTNASVQAPTGTDITLPFPTIQSALNAIGTPIDVADSKKRFTVLVAPGEYDEDISIPEARIIALVALGPVTLGDGAGSNFASTVPRSVTMNLDQSKEFGVCRPTTTFCTLLSGAGETSSTHTGYAVGWVISGNFLTNLSGGPGNETTHEVHLYDVKVEGDMDGTAAPGCLGNLYHYRCFFDGAYNMPTNILQVAEHTEFDSTIIISGYTRITDCEISNGMTVSSITTSFKPEGIFDSDWTGQFDGNTTADLYMDAQTYYSYRVNGGTTVNANNVIIGGVQGMSADGGVEHFDRILEFLSTATVTVNDLGNNQFSFDASGSSGSEPMEKPTDHVEVHALPTSLGNGNQGQRCVTVLQDGRELTLWLDSVDQVLYLTVKNPYYSDMVDTDYARHSRTYPINLLDYDTEGPLTISSDADFCITSEVGTQEGEMIHIVVCAYNVLGGKNIYDGYFPSVNLPGIDFSGAMNNNPGDPGLNLPAPYGDNGTTPNLLKFEIVNPTVDSDESNACRHPSCCADPSLVNGAGIVVVWSQLNNPLDPLVTSGIYSNFYDPNQVAGQRYAILLTLYQEGIVHPAGAPGAVFDLPTVECDNNNMHSAFVGVGSLWYSATPATGVFLAPNLWDTPALIPVNSFGIGLNFLTEAPSMVIVDNLDQVQTNIIIAIIGDNFYCYLFDMAGMVAGLPIIFNENLVSLFDGSKNSDDVRYQLGCSDYQYQAGTNTPILYLYRTMNPSFDGLDNSIDYILATKAFDYLYDADSNAWTQITLKSNIGLPNGLTSPHYKPKVNYSFMYNKRGWQNNVTKPHFYPLNNFFISKTIFNGIELALSHVMISNEFVFERPPGP